MPTNDGNTPPTFPAELVRKMMLTNSEKKIAKDATVAAGELLRLFVLEARSRASIEAECEDEGNMTSNCNDEDNDGRVLIRDDHITKIAAELLMDFS